MEIDSSTFYKSKYLEIINYLEEIIKANTNNFIYVSQLSKLNTLISEMCNPETSVFSMIYNSSKLQNYFIKINENNPLIITTTISNEPFDNLFSNIKLIISSAIVESSKIEQKIEIDEELMAKKVLPIVKGLTKRFSKLVLIYVKRL